MIDTHTHLYYPDYGEEAKDIMQKCSDLGIFHLVLPNVDENSIPDVKNFHSRFPKQTSMAIGIHPTEVKDNWKDGIPEILEELATGEYVAIGEVGIDLHWDKTTLDLQKEAFKKFLTIAEERNLPVIIHSREAFKETLDVIKEVKPTVPLIFHSFTGNIEDVRNIREICDPYFGINGVVTFKNAQYIREALPEIGIDRILLETDAPYLAPSPHRGERNDSSLIVFVRDKIAEVLGITPAEVEKITDDNAIELFQISRT